MIWSQVGQDGALGKGLSTDGLAGHSIYVGFYPECEEKFLESIDKETKVTGFKL